MLQSRSRTRFQKWSDNSLSSGGQASRLLAKVAGLRSEFGGVIARAESESSRMNLSRRWRILSLYGHSC